MKVGDVADWVMNLVQALVVSVAVALGARAIICCH